MKYQLSFKKCIKLKIKWFTYKIKNILIILVISSLHFLYFVPLIYRSSSERFPYLNQLCKG